MPTAPPRTDAGNPYGALLVALVSAIGGCPSPSPVDPPVVDDTGEGPREAIACLIFPTADATCPASADVDPTQMMADCGSEVLAILGEGVVWEVLPFGGLEPDTGTDHTYCCYKVRETAPTCEYGRPYVDGDTARIAAATARDWPERSAHPDVAAMPPEARALLAAAWTKAALDEHAAIATFARVSLELLTFGAPPDLLEATAQAGLDEVRHARLGFALASAYAGEPVGPGAFPLPDGVVLARSLVALAVAAAREGCIGETLTTLVATEALAATTDGAVREALSTIIADELRHAALAWRTVAWAIAAGGAEVRDAVAAEFAHLEARGLPLPERLATGPHAALLAAHGVPTRAAAARAITRGIANVVLPAARVLLGAAPAVRPEGTATIA